MITEKKTYNTGPYVELQGLAEDVANLPTDVANGSTFTEIDTGKVRMFDGEHVQWDAINDGGAIAPVALTATENGTYTRAAGGYSPVTVNVQASGGYVAYTKTANSFSALKFSADECDILLGASGEIAFKSGTYNITSGIKLKQDEDYFVEIGWLLLFWFLFGWITLGVSAANPHTYACTLNAPYTTNTYDASAATNISITFYVTPAQKAALDAL